MERYTHILTQIRRLLEEKDSVLVAIDGNCTAGKTTLAAKLAKEFPCNVLHMDEFFLRPEQRTAQRLAQAGGNVDYERFQQEILLPLLRGEQITYRPFDCSIQALKGPVTLPPKKLTIIEGTYCCHPCFGDPYDLKLFLSVSPEVQRQRILQRPAFKHRRFFEEWIPMEQRYFDTFHIQEHCTVLHCEQEETWH